MTFLAPDKHFAALRAASSLTDDEVNWCLRKMIGFYEWQRLSKREEIHLFYGSQSSIRLTLRDLEACIRHPGLWTTFDINHRYYLLLTLTEMADWITAADEDVRDTIDVLTLEYVVRCKVPINPTFFPSLSFLSVVPPAATARGSQSGAEVSHGSVTTTNENVSTGISNILGHSPARGGALSALRVSRAQNFAGDENSQTAPKVDESHGSTTVTEGLTAATTESLAGGLADEGITSDVNASAVDATAEDSAVAQGQRNLFIVLDYLSNIDSQTSKVTSGVTAQGSDVAHGRKSVLPIRDYFWSLYGQEPEDTSSLTAQNSTVALALEDQQTSFAVVDHLPSADNQATDGPSGNAEDASQEPIETPSPIELQSASAPSPSLTLEPSVPSSSVPSSSTYNLMNGVFFQFQVPTKDERSNEPPRKKFKVSKTKPSVPRGVPEQCNNMFGSWELPVSSAQTGVTSGGATASTFPIASSGPVASSSTDLPNGDGETTSTGTNEEANSASVLTDDREESAEASNIPAPAAVVAQTTSSTTPTQTAPSASSPAASHTQTVASSASAVPATAGEMAVCGIKLEGVAPFINKCGHVFTERTKKAVEDHLKDHGLLGPGPLNGNSVQCPWSFCNNPQIKRDNLVTHVFKIHVKDDATKRACAVLHCHRVAKPGISECGATDEWHENDRKWQERVKQSLRA